VEQRRHAVGKLGVGGSSAGYESSDFGVVTLPDRIKQEFPGRCLGSERYDSSDQQKDSVYHEALPCGTLQLT
jgi:hypothetical protein